MATYLMNDLYTASGSARLFGCWTEAVTKHTPSNFYNYEEDNLPLYDLDERDELLWEQLGYPTSSVPGMVLLVSADAPAGSVACNKNIFYDVSSLQKALPKFINYPLIIEVASYGDLGELELKDITMGPSGSLEIINRLNHAPPFFQVIDASAYSRVSTGPHTNYAINKNVSAGVESNFYNFISNANGFSPSSLLLNTYVMSGGVAISQFKTDERALTAFKGFYGSRPASQEVSNQEFTRLSVADLTLPLNWGLLMNVTGSVYEEQSLSEIYSYDPSCFNQTTGNETFRTFPLDIEDSSSYQRFVAYGNYFRKITVTNCNGPLYIRGFYCSGDGQTSEIGVEVNDSTVSFEGLAVDHFVSKGISIKNSTVDFKRDLFVNRCYGLDSGGNRLSGDWLTINSKSFDPPKDDSAGIEALNSEIFFDTTEEHTAPLAAANGGVFNAGLYLRVISRNSTGMRLINSLVRGGSSRPTNRLNSAAGVYYMDFLSFEGNANYGIELENSRFRFEGRLEVFNNTRGIRSANSNFNVEEFCVENNQIYGMYLDNSEFKFNLNGVSATERFDFSWSRAIIPDTRYTKQFSYKFKQNGQHLIMRNSTFRPSKFPSMEKFFGRMLMIDAHGISDDSIGSLLPSVQMDSSVAEFIHLTSIRAGESLKVAKGAHIYASNNSELTCLGTVSAINSFIAGSDTPTYSEMKHYAAICAENGSTVKFRGPNIVYDGAVNVYANRNSSIVFEPHKKQNGEFDIEGFSLTDPRSHTMIELKGYNSCLVANNNSNIIMEDLGDYTVNWPFDETVSTNYATSSEGFNFAAYTSAGFFQFYPNPNESYDYTQFPQVLQNRGTLCQMTENGTGSNEYYFGRNFWDIDPFDLSALTEGGVCLRALNNSNVRVRNVHFPCGWWNASAAYYDTSSSEGFCCRTFIWNVANNSTMHVDHVSVSSTYPYLAGYHGPSAVWVSGANNEPAYGLPSGTPDTSSLSILDFFGVGSGVGNAWVIPDGTVAVYGQTSFENQGPFRLYVGVDSMANSLVHAGGVGLIQQIYAQGYAPSGPAYCLPDTSALYGKLFHVNENGNLATSGYFYADQMVKCDPNSIMLDESAASLFANAKNGAMGTSRRPQICTIYSAENSNYGEGRKAINGVVGKGFKSANIFDLLEEN